MDKLAQERRNYFRVDDCVLLHYRQVSDAEMQEGIGQLKQEGFAHEGMASMLVAMESRLTGLFSTLRETAPQAAECFELLNNKLNSVIDFLPVFKNPEDKLLNQPPRQCNLSASGIAFVNEEMLEQDTKLLLRLVLPPDYTYLSAYARVVRCEPLPKPVEDYRYTVAVEFVFLLERNREALIKKVMQRQSHTLRLRRELLDAERSSGNGADS